MELSNDISYNMSFSMDVYFTPTLDCHPYKLTGSIFSLYPRLKCSALPRLQIPDPYLSKFLNVDIF